MWGGGHGALASEENRFGLLKQVRVENEAANPQNPVL